MVNIELLGEEEASEYWLRGEVSLPVEIVYDNGTILHMEGTR